MSRADVYRGIGIVDQGHLLEELTSDDVLELVDGLSQLGTLQGQSVERTLLDAAANLADHIDPEVRHDAVKSLGLHLAWPGTIPIIRRIVSNRSEAEHVLEVSIASLGAIATCDGSQFPAAAEILGAIVGDESYSEAVRGSALLVQLFIEGRINATEYGSASTDLCGVVARFCPDGEEPKETT